MKRKIIYLVPLLVLGVISKSFCSTLSDEQIIEVQAMIEKMRGEILAECNSEKNHATVSLSHSKENDNSESNNAAPVITAIPEQKEPYEVIEDLSSYNIEASTASSSASISFDRTTSIFDEAKDLLDFSSKSVKFSAPTDKSNDFTNIASLDGLANSFKFTFDYFKFSGPFPYFDDDNKPIYDKHRKDWFYRLSATIGYEEFKFFDQNDFSKSETEKQPWSIGVMRGFIPTGKNSKSSYSIGMTYQSSYKAADAKTLCPINLGSLQTECVTGSFLAPENRKKLITHYESRSQVQFPLGKNNSVDLGLIFRVSHDLKNNETGVDLPIYFLRDKEGALNSGIRFGWTDTDDLSFGVFVGSTFKFLDF